MRSAALGKQYADYPWYVGTKLFQIKRNATKRGIVWSLSDDEAKDLILRECAYCGCETVARSAAPGWNLTGVNGIDRLDSKIGYLPDNCITACHACNIAKAQMSLQDFIEWLKRVTTRLQKQTGVFTPR